MTEIQDERSEDQKLTHRLAVVGTDRFLSGWGKAEGGASYAAWSFTDGEEASCLAQISSRPDMMRVRVVTLAGYRAAGAKHLHIYIYRPRAPEVI
ncbi:MAG: hypothetical protein V3S68_04810 [Dehalococcoidia bacterium]